MEPRRSGLEHIVWDGEELERVDEFHENKQAVAFLEELERSKDTPQSIQCIDFSCFFFSLFLSLAVAGIGNDGFTRFVDVFIDNPHLKLRELRLQGNNLGPNQITYLTNQLHFGSLSASKAFIFPDLRVLDLSSTLFLSIKSHSCR